MRVHEPQSLTRHVDRLYRAAWAMCGSPQNAEELTRDAFARVLSSRRLLDRDDELHELFRALRSTFRTGRRMARQLPASAATLGAVVAEDPSSTRGPESGPEIREVYASIAELPENVRQALVAVDVLGFTYRGAARALGVSEEAVTARVFRARTRLAADLTPGGAQALGT